MALKESNTLVCRGIVVLLLKMETGEGALSTLSTLSTVKGDAGSLELLSVAWAGLHAVKTGLAGFSAMGDRVGTIVGVELDLV